VKRAESTGRRQVRVHVVTGPVADEVRDLILKLCQHRPDWIAFVNAAPAPSAPNLRRLPIGCPCCTGKLALQVALVRELRDPQLTRAFVEVDPTHAASLEGSLAQPPFDLSLSVARRIELPRDGGLMPQGIEEAVP
jgi:hypothetical protein